jgi:hypothetical protein
MKDVFHSPDWYRRRVSEDYINPKVKSMLVMDCEDYYDSKATPEELIDLYEERWNSADFMMDNGARINEIHIEEMRLDNQALYKGLILGYGTGEETYLKVIDDIARDMLIGSDKLLVLFIKRIRTEAQKPLQLKKKERAKMMYPSTKGMKGLDEDETLFTWNNPIGDQKDYRKELHYHVCIISVMSAVEERIKMITEEETSTLQKLKSKYTERMNEVSKLFAGDIDEGWVSRWLQIPIREQNNFVSEIEDSVERIKKENESSQSNTDAIEKVKAVLDRNKGASKRLTGFE